MSALPALFGAFRALVRAPSFLATRAIKPPQTFQNVLIKQTFCSKADPKPISVQEKLMNFFDEKKNWGEQEVQVGRSWRTDELRIKSNTDLHKLWYILLKERNMLLTMESECSRAYKLFPNPERIDKVQDSMANIETVVRERNKAYHMLEVGETGERVGKQSVNQLGLRYFYKNKEHSIPRWLHTKFHHIHRRPVSMAVAKFLRLYKEKRNRIRMKAVNRERNHVQHLLKRFPDMDMDKLKDEYPNTNIDKLKYNAKSRGHFVPKEFQ